MWFRVFVFLTLGISLSATEFRCLLEKDQEYALIRMTDSKVRLLLVNTNTLQTKTSIRTKSMMFRKCQKNSRYENLKKELLARPFKVANRGMVEGSQKGYAVTVDMCPSSKKGFELEFFKALIQKQKGCPVTISMTKKWAIHHPKEFAMLKAWDDEKKLTITWMNHGTMHPYAPHVPLEKNFINLEGIDFKKEVLENESFLIKEGRVPSIFYRFAGLVSNEKAFNYLVKDLGLIPVGSLAWLAKGEMIKNGSIVLLHGNKNEPLGIKRFLEVKTTLPVVNLPQLFIKD